MRLGLAGVVCFFRVVENVADGRMTAGSWRSPRDAHGRSPSARRSPRALEAASALLLCETRTRPRHAVRDGQWRRREADLLQANGLVSLSFPRDSTLAPASVVTYALRRLPRPCKLTVLSPSAFLRDSTLAPASVVTYAIWRLPRLCKLVVLPPVAHYVVFHYCLLGQVEDWLVVGNERRKLGRNARLAPSLLG